MSARRKSRNTRRAPRKRLRKKPAVWLRRIAAGVISLALVGAVVLAGYLLYLDRTITATFDGRRWSVPAQVYAQPVELHPGALLDMRALTTELDRLGYTQLASLPHSGTYKRTGSQLSIFLRPFQFADGARPATLVHVSFGDGRIRRIEAEGGRRKSIPLMRLDPVVIGSFFPSHGEDRLVLTPEQVPALLSAGLKAVEDRNFDTHVGFSVRGILRALLVNIKAGDLQQGGSTLTQQLVKSYFLDNRRTLERKLQELAMAVILDARFAKDDLLTAYVNEIFLGQNGTRAIHGFGLGAQFYFNKPLSELDPHEIATLIAIIRGPSYYNPFRHPQRALERRDRILNTFLADNLIDAKQHSNSVARELGVVRGGRRGGAYHPAFMDLVRQELAQHYDPQALASQDLSVFTTLEPPLQEATQAELSRTLAAIETERDNIGSGQLQGAALIASAHTGEVLALAGGRDGSVDGFNRVLHAKRPVGSVIKPLVVLAALERGLHLASSVPDEPIEVDQGQGKIWSPSNFDHRHRGPVPLVRALGDSLNLATVHVGLQVGMPAVQQRFTDLFGRPPQNRYPSLLLGAESLTPLDVLTLYANFASGGFSARPKSVVTVLQADGNPVRQHGFTVSSTIRRGDAQALTRALLAVMQHGTGRRSPYSQRGVAGKTGTSDDNRDSWFAGYDQQHVATVWVGRDDNKPTGLTGSSGALRVWSSMIAKVGVYPIELPANPDLVEIEYTTGLHASARCAEVVQVPVPRGAQLPAKRGCAGKRLAGSF